MLSRPAPVAESFYHDYFQPSGMCRLQPFAATGVVVGASAPWDMRSSGHFIQLGGTSERLFDLLALYGSIQQQLYDPEADMFLPDRYVKGTCPKCGYEEAFGDQCENCGTSLSPTDLIHPVSSLTGEKPQIKETEHWFIPLGDSQEWLES